MPKNSYKIDDFRIKIEKNRLLSPTDSRKIILQPANNLTLSTVDYLPKTSSDILIISI